MIKTKRPPYHFFILILISINCHSQSQNYSIDFYNGLTIEPTYYHIQIQRDSYQARILLEKTVKVNYKKLERDKQYKLLLDSVITCHVDNSELMLQEIEKIQSNYIRSYKDEITVLLQDYPDYFAQIDSIYKCDSEFLLNKLRNKNRIVLDGTTMHMTVISDSTEKKNLFFNSPSVNSHPLIAKTINYTFRIYSEKTRKEFLKDDNK